MGIRGVVQTVTADPISRLGKQISDIKGELERIRSIVRRDCLKVRGYEVQYRTTPTPGVYLVNLRDGDPNYGTATFLGA